MSDAPEPPAVTTAREGVANYNKKVLAYVLAICAATGAMVGVGAAFDEGVFFWLTFAAMLVITFAGIPFLDVKKYESARHTIRAWEQRALKEEFDRFDRAASAEASADPRMEAAAGMADRIRALQASDANTDDMVTRLEKRLGQLITDESAARTAVDALAAAGAGSVGTERLAAAGQHLEAEIGRILTGMSDLYAALLEAESGATKDPTAGLAEVMTWLAAEAEIARAAQDEAMRPARESAAAKTMKAAE